MNPAHVETNGQRETDRQHASQVKTDAALGRELFSRVNESPLSGIETRHAPQTNAKPRGQFDFVFSFTDLEVWDILYYECRARPDNDFSSVIAEESMCT